MNTILRFAWNLVFNLTRLDISFDVKYQDWSFFLIELKADYERVREMLSERNFIPKEIAPGETRLQIVGCDMRDVQISGPYRELSIQVPVESLDDSPADKYAHLYLPVTTEAARWPGVDILGFPKWIAQIDIEKDGDQVECRLGAKIEPIVEFRIDDKLGSRGELKWEYYGIRKGQIIKTTFDLKGQFFEEMCKSKASVVLGKQTLAENLREIILSDEVIRTMVGHNVSGILRKPKLITN